MRVTTNNLAAATKISITLIACATFTPSLQSQNSEWKPSIDEKSKEIIDRCIAAMGGEMQLDAIETIELKGTSESSKDGVPVRGMQKARKLFLKNHFSRSVISSETDETIVFVQRGKLSWRITDGNEAEARISTSQWIPLDTIPWPANVLRWQDSDNAICFIESTKRNGKDVNTLSFRGSNGALTYFHFDVGSGLLSAVVFKLVASGVKIHTTLEFEYKTVDGIALPLTQRILQPKNLNTSIPYDTSKIQYEVVEIGGEIPEEYFELTPALRARLEELTKKRKK